MNRYENFECHTLDDDGNLFFCGELPERLRIDAEGFETLWRLHPQAYQIIKMFGQPVPTPRWQQAYGVDYYYTGQTNRACPCPRSSEPILAWSQKAVHEEHNGLLFNWYDGQLEHYIGPHKDNMKNMIVGAPIVTISLGEERIFRLSSRRPAEARLPGTGRDGVHHALRDEPSVEARRPSFRPLAWPPHFYHHPGVRGCLSFCFGDQR